MANGASQGNYFQAKIPKMAVFEAKTGLQNLQRHPNVQTFFDMVLIFLFMRDEVRKFRKTVWAACTRQKNYYRFKLKMGP